MYHVVPRLETLEILSDIHGNSHFCFVAIIKQIEDLPSSGRFIYIVNSCAVKFL